MTSRVLPTIALGIYLSIGIVPTAVAQDPPNIVFLLADDMGYADLGCFGSRAIQSPNLDRLAAQGVRLTHCYAASPNCSPARTGMLTGRSPYRVGMYDFARFKPLHIPRAEVTIAEQLKSVGYETMFAGKWHCSGDFDSGNQPYPGDQGFDHWLANKSNFGKDPTTFKRNGDDVGKLQGWMSEIVVDETIQWIEQRDETKPFFTCLWFSEPHTPVVAAEEFKALYRNTEALNAARATNYGGDQVKRKPAWGKLPLYYGCVTMLDHHIGRLLKFLDDRGLTENTIVVFTSDNGPEHRTATCFGSPGDLRGAKGHIHEGGIRVPGIVRWPGKIKAGTESSEPINGTDWLPTLTSAAGVRIPTNGKIIDGANVLPALIDGDQVSRERPMMWWLWHARGGYEVAMRDGDYKMVATMLPQADPGAVTDARQPADWTIMEFIKRAELGRFEMFNVEVDGSETTDLAEVDTRRFEAMKKKMVALHAEIRAEGPVYELGRKKKSQ
ncbi:MAG: sulfatase-like hydrolase/transferase [Pirellulaceae bacterium]